MYYVYFLKSLTKTNWTYIGSTTNLRKRFHQHQTGLSKSTKPYMPLKLDAYIAVHSEKKCRELERYFKSGSGRAILKKRILNDEALA